MQSSDTGRKNTVDAVKMAGMAPDGEDSHVDTPHMAPRADDHGQSVQILGIDGTPTTPGSEAQVDDSPANDGPSHAAPLSNAPKPLTERESIDSAPTRDEVYTILTGVIDPELGSDIVELGMVPDVTIDDDGTIHITIALTTSGCPLRAEIQRDVRNRLVGLPGVTAVKLNWSELTQEQKAATMERARYNVAQRPETTTLPARTRVILVASGKGGVGKSSVTVNLAAALARTGLNVGLLDADIWGFSIPRMLGIDGKLEATSDGQIQPRQLSVPNPNGNDGTLEVVSMGFLVAEETTALMWRGLMLNRAVQHFLEDVAWGDLDYLIVDMPPGTGDVQMGLAKQLPRSEMLVVTTPSALAQNVAARAVDMGRKNFLHVIGVIENMSSFIAPDGSEHHIFGTGGGEDLAERAHVPLIAKVPIEPAVAEGGDTGKPVALVEDSDSPARAAFVEVADQLVKKLAPPRDGAGCSSDILEALSQISAPVSEPVVAST